MASSSEVSTNNTGRLTGQKVEHPRCLHGLKTVLWSSRKESIKGKLYFRCPLNMGSKDCGFYQWVDEDDLIFDTLVVLAANLVEINSKLESFSSRNMLEHRRMGVELQNAIANIHRMEMQMKELVVAVEELVNLKKFSLRDAFGHVVVELLAAVMMKAFFI